MSHKVTVRPSGREFTVEADETILAAALRSGVGLPYGCKNGACGTCKATGLEGEWSQGPHSASALTAEEQAGRRLLVCCSRPTSDLVIAARELSGFGDIPVRKMPCRVASIERPAPDVAIVTLQLPASERLQFRAGQYLEFILKDGSRRSYSMATAPHGDEKITLHVRHMPGGLFTDALFGATQPAVKERDILRIEAPLGTFFLREDNARPIVLLASGTGPNFTYVPVLSDATPEDQWTGRTGFVHRAVMDDLPDLSAWQVYACGAPVMVDAARQDFARCGLPEDQFFADAFTSRADVN